MAALNGLSELTHLTLRGEVSAAALASLDDLPALFVLNVDTTESIPNGTATALREQLESMTLLHINDLPPEDRPTSRSTAAMRREGSDTMHRFSMVMAIVTALSGLITRLSAAEMDKSTADSVGSEVRVLHFPPEQCVGSLHLAGELEALVEPRYVRPG